MTTDIELEKLRLEGLQGGQVSLAKDLYGKFVEACQGTGLKVETGEFAAMMDVSLSNDGPVTFMLESNSIK